MKKLFTLILIVTSIIVLVACGQQNNEPINEATTESTETSAQTDSGEQWPTEYMSVLPKPKAKISFIEKLDGTEEIPEGDTETSKVVFSTTSETSPKFISDEVSTDDDLDIKKQAQLGLFLYLAINRIYDPDRQ